MKFVRFRHSVSTGIGHAYFFRVFTVQASSAICTFCNAVSIVNGEVVDVVPYFYFVTQSSIKRRPSKMDDERNGMDSFPQSILFAKKPVNFAGPLFNCLR